MKAAAVYARQGWSVVPLHSAIGGVCSCSRGAECPNAGKHPRIKEWETEATDDAAQVAEWIARWPAANVGIATGSPSGFFVLDVDGPKGAAALEALEAEHGALPATARQRTGSGGTHFLFTTPDFSVANSASKIGPGLDIRGDGGQIVVAPSRSARGAYQWITPPWQVPIAPAPAWLLELLRRPASRAAPAQEASPATFPPASPAVLEAARAALAEHGPAIEGEGGDEHTFIAAAILVHDFALTDDEAWPLAVEWNATCSPPWSLDDLSAKLRGGGKYASRAFGCRRTLDVVDAARALITAWQTSNGGEPAMWGVIAEVRKLAAVCDDTAKHAVIARDLRAATGLSVRDLALPAPTAPRVVAPSGSVTITPRLHEVADEGVAVIRDRVFARNGVLCEIVKNERTVIADLEIARIRDLLSSGAKWIRVDDKGATVQAPPVDVAATIHARRQHAGVRVLEAVTTAPIFLADGEILQVRGYNAQARVFFEPAVVVDVPDAPSRDDARNAVRLFLDLLRDFHFAERADFSAWLAGLLSPLVKAATGNAPAPLVAVSAASPGAGKSKLVNVASLIVTGALAEVRPYNPRDPAEWGKRITSYVRAASPISVFDNVNGPFGDETIDRLVTSSTWSDRILGVSDAPPIAIVSCWWATGNNIEPQGDTVRRVLPVRIEVREERPQERTDFKYADLEAQALEHRSTYLAAALTILRAYHCAGRPAQALPTWGSFERWSDLVRGALVWTGLPDPFITQRRAAAEWNEADHDAHDFWIACVEEGDGSPASVVASANAKDAAGVLGVRESITTFTLRKFLGRFVERVRRGLRIRKVRDGETIRYVVERLT